MNTNLTSQPAGRRLAAELRRRIVSGDLAEGAQLPSSATLQAEHGVSSTVVRDAINALKADGYVIGQQGKGVFVASAEERSAARDTEGLEERVAALEARVRALEEARSA